jgi:hypothetical protein
LAAGVQQESADSKKNYNQEQMKKAADSRQLEAGAENEGS